MFVIRLIGKIAALPLIVLTAIAGFLFNLATDLSGYVIGPALLLKRGKNIAVKGRAQQRFVRLSSLGEDYTEEALKEKISRANVRDSHRQTQQAGIDLLIDIQNRALGKGAGYERWAKGFNLKKTAKTLLFLQQHDIHSYEELERMTNEAVTGADQLLASIKEKDSRIKEIEALRQHIFDYSKTRKIYLEYKRG